MRKQLDLSPDRMAASGRIGTDPTPVIVSDTIASSRKRVSGRKAADITLARGVTKQSDLKQWIQEGHPAGSETSATAAHRDAGLKGAHLSRIAEHPSHEGAILLDEGDAILATRSEVADAHDRFADGEESSLLASATAPHDRTTSATDP